MNIGRTTSYHLTRFNKKQDPRLPEMLSEGVVSGPAENFLDAEGLRQLDELVSFSKRKAFDPDVKKILQDQDAGKDRKSYFVHLTKGDYDFESPFLRLALNPGILHLVNGYLGMHSLLRSIEMWLHFPTKDEAMETQLWHRDGDDFMNVKVFIYLNDVEMKTGPFCFVPKTHPRSSLNLLSPPSKTGRTDDKSMAMAVPSQNWRVCTGTARTIVFADTAGFHKGLKPEIGERFLLMIQYTSGCPHSPRLLNVKGLPQDRQWKKEEKYALFQ